MTKEKKANVTRTSRGLRDALFDELEALRNGSSNPTQANAVAKLAGSVVETVKMEIEAQKFVAQMDKMQPDSSEIKTLQLGS